jgi:hypothetical protein
MVECPVCGVSSLPGQVACGRCGLPTNLFEEFREVAQAPTAPETDQDDTGKGDLAEGAQVPPISGPTAGTRASLTRESQGRLTWSPALPESNAVPASVPMDRPPVPARPSGPEPSIRMGRSEIEEVRQRVRLKETTVQLTRRRRELIGSVLDALIDRYRRLCDRRDVFSAVIRTQALDTELAAYRRALSNGDIAQAEERRKAATRMITSIEASWHRVSSQITDANQMIRALRELGGVAPSVLRPVAAAVRVPRRAEAAQIERRLKQANSLLWKLLAPRMDHELSKYRSTIAKVDAPTSRADAVRSEIERMAEKIRQRKVGEALETRRFLRAELATIVPRAPRRPAGRFAIDQTHRS